MNCIYLYGMENLFSIESTMIAQSQIMAMQTMYTVCFVVWNGEAEGLRCSQWQVHLCPTLVAGFKLRASLPHASKHDIHSAAQVSGFTIVFIILSLVHH